MTEDKAPPAAADLVVVWTTRPRPGDDWWWPFTDAVEVACTAAASAFAGRWSSGPPAGQPSVCMAFTVPPVVREGLREELERIAGEFGGALLTWAEMAGQAIPATAETSPVP